MACTAQVVRLDDCTATRESHARPCEPHAIAVHATVSTAGQAKAASNLRALSREPHTAAASGRHIAHPLAALIDLLVEVVHASLLKRLCTPVDELDPQTVGC